jgi:hypothetical protein
MKDVAIAVVVACAIALSLLLGAPWRRSRRRRGRFVCLTCGSVVKDPQESGKIFEWLRGAVSCPAGHVIERVASPIAGFVGGASLAFAAQFFALVLAGQAQSLIPGSARIILLLVWIGVALAAWRRVSRAAALAATRGAGTELAPGLRAVGIGMLAALLFVIIGAVAWPFWNLAAHSAPR